MCYFLGDSGQGKIKKGKIYHPGDSLTEICSFMNVVSALMLSNEGYEIVLCLITD